MAPEAPPPAPALPGIPLKINSKPWGAQATINGESVGETPVQVERPPGTYKVLLKYDGRQGYRKVVLPGDDGFCWDFESNSVCR